jgi:membrane protease YdiL (CAAX protease family)
MNEPQLDILTSPINTPTIKNAKILFLTSLASVIVVGSLMQKYNFWIGLSLTEILLILLPTVVFIVKGKFSPRLVLRLNYPGFVALLIGVVLGLCVWPLGLWIQINLLNLFSSKSYDIFSVVSEIRNSNMVYRLLVMGFLGSICEETLFRGYIQTAIENNLGVKQSILWTTILFSVYHLVPTTMIALLPMALLMCWICWKFNSIFPAMLIHFSNNFLAPYLFIQCGTITLGWFHIIMIGCSLLIIITLFMTKTLTPADNHNYGVRSLL